MMRINRWIRIAIPSAIIAIGTGTNSHCLLAQESSLFRQLPAQAWGPINATVGAPATAQPPANGSAIRGLPMPTDASGYGDVGLPSASWTYTPTPPLRTFRVQDIVTIRVDEITRMTASGAAQSRRNTLHDAILKDWIAFRNGNLGKDLQSTGDPRITGESNELYRADSTIKSAETMAFNVAARVVDIQPNGNLVLEANKGIGVNDNSWNTSLTGICRAQDIGPDNVVLSRDLLNLQIRKNDQGQLRDGYRRGWLTRWLSEFSPF